ncbi:MAG: cytochrome c biogenesis protein CcsA [Phycisphaerales bacterium]
MNTKLIIACIMSLVVVFLPSAHAQPTGNAHPESVAVSESSGETENPFGQPEMSTMDLAAKHAFAEQIDLSELMSAAVFHNGRVKILDTLSRETMSMLTGKPKYFDILVTDYDKPTKLKFEPSFTMLDLMIDPVYYLDRPLIGINYLPLRQEILEMADTEARATNTEFNKQGWLKTGMISPRMTERYTTAAFNKNADYEPFRQAVGKLDRSADIFRSGVSNLLVIAPDIPNDPWKHIGSLPSTHPARVAALDMAIAWRAGDAAAVNAASVVLATELKSIHPEIQANANAGVEVLYNKANAFEWGLWIYLLSLVSLILAFGTGRKSLITLGVALLFAAIAIHAFGFTLRCIIAQRFAIQNQFESMTGISLFAAIVGSVIMLYKKQWLFGAAAAATGFLVLITATQTGIPGETIGREAAILNTSVLLKYHVTTVLTSYGLITLGFVVSVFYLGTHYANKYLKEPKVETAGAPALAAGALGHDTAEKTPGVIRTLKDLDTAQMTILQLAFWTLGVGTLLGAWWADHSWGRWWAFDPKETWALVTWIVYLIVIHARFMQLKDRGLTTAWLSFIGFFVMLWTYFGVNLLLPGLHAYA